MRRCQWIHGAALAVWVTALWATSSAAIDPSSCKAKINGRDGVILVSANDVLGTLQWGEESGNEIYPIFDNTGTCIGFPDEKNCQLGAAGTPERLYPPEGCTLYLKDTGDSSVCSAHIKKCVPGPRPCPSDMVDAGGFCIDIYEASVWDSPTGSLQCGITHDCACSDNGQDCTNIYARSIADVLPSGELTWLQAQQACRNVGKRLPTNAEWQQAVVGTPDTPSDNGTTDCRTNTPGVGLTGFRSSCVSTVGAFDMVGNLLEFVADWLPSPTACPGWGAFSDDENCLGGAATSAPYPAVLARGGDSTSGPLAGPMFAISGPPHAYGGAGFRCVR